MKKELILLLLLTLNLGCIFSPSEVSMEEKAKIPNIHKLLDDYTKKINPKAILKYSHFKSLDNSRPQYTPNVSCYNVTDKEEINKIIQLLQENMQGAPDWYYLNIKFYDKLNFVKRGDWMVLDAKILLETKIRPAK